MSLTEGHDRLHEPGASCVDLYKEIVRLRPEWHSEGDDEGVCKIVMTGSASDPADWQQHVRSKTRREALRQRFREPEDPSAS